MIKLRWIVSIFLLLLFVFCNATSSRNITTNENHALLDNLEKIFEMSLLKDKVERLSSFADACSEMGMYVEAKESYLEVLDDIEVISNNSSKYVEILLKTGYVCIKLGDYKEAEKYLYNVKDIYLEGNELDKNYEVNLYFYLGHLYQRVGNYIKAEECYLKAEEINSQLEEGSFFNDISYVTSLGYVYNELHREGEIEENQGKALDIYNKSETLSIEDSLSLLIYIGNTYFEQQKFEKAEYVYLKALQLANDINYIEVKIIVLNNLGYLYYIKNDYTKAEKYYKEILYFDSDKYGGFYADFLVNIGDVYIRLNLLKQAEVCFRKASVIVKQEYSQSVNFMTESERKLCWIKLSKSFEKRYPLLSYRYHFVNPSISIFSYDNELFSKGLLLTSSNLVRESIINSADSILIKKWNELTSAKQVVMHLEENEPQSQVLEKYRHRADSLEKIVTKSSAVFRESKEQWNINWESVKKQLSKNEVAIEYFSAPLSQDSTMYCALLLRHNSEYPELIPLFDEKEVTKITSTINESIDNSLLYNYNKYGATLSEKVWSKILPRVKEGGTIYFSPSGLLHQLAIEFLPVDSVRTMSDVYNMVRLSSTRELALNKKQTSKTRATVYGGISYTLDKETMQTESRRYASQERSIDADILNRGTAIDLPATLVEAKYIDSLLVANNITTTLFTSEKANEESFKALSGKGNRILHIATHGFTWTDSVARKQDYFASRIQMIGDNLPKGPVIDPLNRCGLLFAGANTALQGKSKELPQGVQDGILMAKEISLMDLRDAELVVLSACETAKGDITSEGVFGLQRAFKMAGAKTIIMSLWKVDDNATQLLMTEFYTNWITKKQQKREAFRNAQNAVRYYKDKYGDYIYLNKPYYWAGFIMLD